MAETVYEHPHLLKFVEESGTHEFRVTVVGEEREDKTWAGWIEFTDVQTGDRLRTDQETSQPSRYWLWFWATGLEHIYFDGALERARRYSLQ